jgi:hypothetical protein
MVSCAHLYSAHVYFLVYLLQVMEDGMAEAADGMVVVGMAAVVGIIMDGVAHG